MTLQPPCLPQVFELYSDFLKYFPGTHRQIYRNMQEVKDFIDHSVEKHRETLDPNAPRDFIDTYLLRMDKVGFERGEGRGGRKRWGAVRRREGNEDDGKTEDAKGILEKGRRDERRRN